MNFGMDGITIYTADGFLVYDYWVLALGRGRLAERVERLRRFLNAHPGVDPNAGHRFSFSPTLHIASSALGIACIEEPVSSHEHEQVLTMLLEYGADIDYIPPIHRTASQYLPVTPIQVAIIKNRPHAVRFLLQRGASLGVFQGWQPPPWLRPGGAEWWEESTALYRAVLAAGGWRRFAREPCVALVVLKVLCERGRATPPPGVAARIFGLPNEIFFSVLTFWQGNDRDTRPLPTTYHVKEILPDED